MRRWLLTYLVLILALPAPCLAGGDTSLVVSPEEWRAVSEGHDYTETYLEPETRLHTPSPKSSGGGLHYLYYLLIVVVLVVAVVWLTRNLKGNPKIEPAPLASETSPVMDEQLHELDLEQLLKQAVARGEFRLAVRLNFLIVIKLLSQKEYIHWAKEKTNWEYYTELPDRLLADQFRELVVHFEGVWYGEHPLDIRQYSAAETAYKAMQERLSPHP